MKSNNITKVDFFRNINNKTGFPISISKKIVDDLLIICAEMIKNNELVFKNIGTFKLSKKNERIGRNPKTKEEKNISERNVVLFKPSKDFKEFINQSNEK